MFNSVFPLDSFANLEAVPEAEKSLRKWQLRSREAKKSFSGVPWLCENKNWTSGATREEKPLKTPQDLSWDRKRATLGVRMNLK